MIFIMICSSVHICILIISFPLLIPSLTISISDSTFCYYKQHL